MREEVIISILLFAGIIIFPVFLLLFIVKYNNAKSQRRTEKRDQAFQEGLKGTARIVDLRRPTDQRSKDFELYKILLEVFPENAPSFSVVIIWEIEPIMKNSIQIGSSLPVKINTENMQQVFPDVSGMRYSYTYQFAHFNIENDFQSQQIILTPKLSPYAPKAKTIFRKRSAISLFGTPLWEIAINLKRHKYARRAKARAIIAVGDSAAGVIAIGYVARGFISVGAISFGLFSIGGLSFGLLSIGLNSIGLVSLGSIGLGLLAIGGVSFGYFSAGLLPFGIQILGRDFEIPALLQIFQNFKNLIGLNYNPFDFTVIFSLVGFAILLGTLIGKSIISKMLQPNSNSLESPRK